jgi:nucleotide-binding universal stress UspA family protein
MNTRGRSPELSLEDVDSSIASGVRFKKILVAIDGSDNAKRAARVAIVLAKKFGSVLFAVHVIKELTYSAASDHVLSARATRRYIDSAKTQAERWISEVVSRAERQGIKARGEVIENVPSIVDAILDDADEWKVDLIILGTRGLSGLKKLIAGSVSSGVVSHARCSVLVVK